MFAKENKANHSCWRKLQDAAEHYFNLIFFCRLLNSLDSVLSLPSFLFTLSQLRFDSEAATNLQQNYDHLDTHLLPSLFPILSMLMIMASGGRSSR